MKTLDEVIELSERCTLPYPGDCLNCEYFEDETGYDCRCKIIADALQYLKVLQKMQKAQPLEKSEWSELYNQPLTWAELQQMEGKPVWVEYGISFNQKRWVVIHSFHNTGSFCYMDVSGNYPNTFWQKDMGEDEFWQAYRKERGE